MNRIHAPLSLDWNTTYEATKRKSLLVTSLVIFTGYILGLHNHDINHTLNVFNIITALVTIVFLALMHLRLIGHPLASVIIFYSLFLNLFLSLIFYPSPAEDIVPDILLSTIIIGLLLPIAGFLAGKIHALVMGGLYILLFTAMLTIRTIPYFQNYAALMYLIICSYILGMYYLLHTLENTSLSMNKLVLQLRDKNQELIEKNHILIDQKKLIEKQKDELSAAIGSRDTLFSLISHDLRNPLHAILSFCELIEEKYRKNEQAKVIEYVRTMQQSASNLYRLLVNLLDWTRIQTGKMQACPETIDAGQEIENSLSFFMNTAAKKEISLEQKIMPGIKLFADKNMFDTIIRNFLSNAIKFTAHGGKIEIEARTESDTFYFSVRDSGTGMSTEDIERILQPGMQIPAAGTEGEHGTGLGLELCKQFIQLHRGTLTIQSELNRGTNVIMRLPVGVERAKE